MFATDDPDAEQPDAISAVKALQIASAEGQRVYQISQENMSTALANINHDQETMDEIEASLNAGKEVITHTDAVSVPGWSGAGYIVLDPDTGAGAYKISGGANGCFFYIGATYSILFVASLHDGLAGAGALAFALGMLIAIVAVWFLYGIIYGEDAQKCFLTGLAVGLLAGGLLARLIGIPLGPNAGEASALIGALAAIDVATLDREGVEYCLNH
jgi:hypothetical protein